MVGRSGALGVLLEVVADERVSWRGIELAGQGIALYAYGNRWMLSAGKDSLSGEDLARILIPQEDLIADLEEAWRAYESGQTSREDLVPLLQKFVVGFECLYPRASDS